MSFRKEDHPLSALPEETRFEHFAVYITVQRHHTETFDSGEIVTQGDSGIDAIAIIVNGSLVTDLEAFEEQADRAGSLDVTFVFVQKLIAVLDLMPPRISGTFGFGVLDFFKNNLTLEA